MLDHHVVVKIASFKDALNALVVLKQFLEQRLYEAMSFIKSHVHDLRRNLKFGV